MSALYTSDIDCLAKRMLTHINWLGVHPIDLSPAVLNAKTPLAFVLNCDPSNSPGTHWLAFFLSSNSNSLELFDSFGLNPMHYSLEHVFPNQKLLYSSHVFQSPDTQVCGHYALVFLYLRSHGYSYSSIINNFSNISRSRNALDVYILEFARKLAVRYEIINPCTRSNSYREQCCISKKCFACNMK